MAKGGKGAVCPICNQQTFHDEGSYRECSRCNCLGWAWDTRVRKVGKGKGYKCPHCDNQTFHQVVVRKGESGIRRCKTCAYSLIQFPKSGKPKGTSRRRKPRRSSPQTMSASLPATRSPSTAHSSTAI